MQKLSFLSSRTRKCFSVGWYWMYFFALYPLIQGTKLVEKAPSGLLFDIFTYNSEGLFNLLHVPSREQFGHWSSSVKLFLSFLNVGSPITTALQQLVYLISLMGLTAKSYKYFRRTQRRTQGSSVGCKGISNLLPSLWNYSTTLLKFWFVCFIGVLLSKFTIIGF